MQSSMSELSASSSRHFICSASHCACRAHCSAREFSGAPPSRISTFFSTHPSFSLPAAGPIGEALIATAVGILTAIPAVLLYNYFVRQLRVRNTELEGFAEDLLRLVGQQAAKTPSKD